MYDTSLTRQSLPSEQYRLLLGTALCVFSSNNGFIIENILRTDGSLTWHDLIDMESGQLKPLIENTISQRTNNRIAKLFDEIVYMRNRIIHGFRITNGENEQVMATKVKGAGEQFEITEKYMREFIRKNDELSNMLHDYRGY